MNAELRPLYIAGPTGSGKSEAALELAESWGAEIVNADAFQLYAGMPVLTAVPGPEARRRVPHHLYEVCSLEDEFDAARYEREASRVVAEVQARGRRPLVVGGSGLYLKALTHGLAPTPPGDDELRRGLGAMSEAGRVAWLEKLDSAGAARLNLRNPRYVMRALEITLLSGVPASVLRASWRREDPTDLEGILISWERETLYERINRRVERMLEEGALDEVARLPSSISPTAAKAIGVTEIQRHLAGACSLEEAMQAIQQATRRYAKRQETWFRRERIFRKMTLEEACRLAPA